MSAQQPNPSTGTGLRGDERLRDEEVSLAWLADRLQAFVDAHPDFEIAVDRLATWLARDDQE